MDLTVITCNYNTPDLTINMLKSLKLVSSELPKVLVMNTSKSHQRNALDDNDIPYYNFRHGIHGEAVNLGLKKITTRYALLVDTDVIFLQDWQKPFQKLKDGNFTMLGKVVGDCGGKSLYERVEPWYCFMDLTHIKSIKARFFDVDRTKASKTTNKVYDVGSTLFEDVTKAGGLIGNVDLEGKYFKHYGGMSWRTQKYNPNVGDTDIDFGGTHPHKVLYDIGLRVRQEYDRETAYLEDVNIKGEYSYE
jgi:hypothetical protein